MALLLVYTVTPVRLRYCWSPRCRDKQLAEKAVHHRTVYRVKAYALAFHSCTA
jgi:hypothetical protein